jgi:1-acyl-sn-glycerol-3-phosphate acyltransferase
MVPAVSVLAVVLLATAIAWVPVLLAVDIARRRWRLPLVRFTVFGLMWAWLEVWGVASAATLWLMGRGSDSRANYRLQARWTRGVVAALRLTVGLSIEVEGAPARGDGPFVALCRHASLADSVMSAWVFVTHSALRPRYVLKRELELDPCLDIVGHRLPNYFVDRTSANVAGELEGIATMAGGLSVGDIAVIFPEGTRANPAKRARMLESLAGRSPARAERLAGLRHLLPPKPAGAAALLQAVPHARVLTMWHSGFDGMDTFGGILRHLGAKAVKVHVRIVEHQRSTIATGESFVAWLDQQWVAMDESVSHHLARLNLVPSKENTHG